jgi:carbon monoxide dehydrogenase subunit G
MRTLLAALFVGVAFAPGLIAVSPGVPFEKPVVEVREQQGGYAVDAKFVVTQPPAVVIAVLTDYEQIPRYMPSVKKSVVQERTGSGAIVEQEAVSKVMFFSKRVHLLLEVEEAQTTVRFRDTCGRSFSRYEGTWTLTHENGLTIVRYQLTAKPSFDVPEFLIKRLLRRDSVEMIEHLRTEISRRGS